MNIKLYNILKWLSQILLPALGTLYFALSTFWNFPYADHIIGTIAAVDTFLGALLMIKGSSSATQIDFNEIVVLTPEMDEELSNGKGDDSNE